MSARVDAAVKEYFASEGSTTHNRIGYVLEAADAHDAANGVHRVSLDDSTVERAAEALFMANNPEADWSRFSKKSRVKDAYRDQARAVLAAAVKEGQ